MRISCWFWPKATPSLKGPQPRLLNVAQASPLSWTSRKKSEYILKTSSSLRIFASLLHCFCSGWAWTILCNARPTRFRISFVVCNRSLLCSILTRKGTTRWWRIMSQLVGVEDKAKNVMDIFSISLPPSNGTKESTVSILMSISSAFCRRNSLFREWTDEVKLITEADSSWNSKYYKINDFFNFHWWSSVLNV